jgi:Protein of unknown function (DUF1348)
MDGKEIVSFLARKWTRELDYRLIKESGSSLTTGSRCALPTNGTMTPEIGFVRMGMRIGNSMKAV